jgi:hypothetical protein
MNVMVRRSLPTQRGMRDSLRDQQLANPDSHFVNFRSLEKWIGESKKIGSGHGPPLNTVNFVEAVSAEICLVNTSFEKRRLEILEQIAVLRRELEDLRADEAVSTDPLEGVYFWQRARVALVEVLESLTRLRDYAMFNCSSVLRIHKRWSKQVPTDVQDKNLRAVIEKLQSSPEEWLRQLRYMDGLEFAELYIVVESLKEVPVLRPSCPGSPCSPDQPSPQLRPSSASSSSDWVRRLNDSCNESNDTAVILNEGSNGAAAPKASSALCIACLTDMAASTASLLKQSLSPHHQIEVESTIKFGCGHQMCHVCFSLGRFSNALPEKGRADRPFHDDQQTELELECAICRHRREFVGTTSNGIRSFRGVLAQFMDNLNSGAPQYSLRTTGERQQVGVHDPTTSALAKHVGSCCELSNA